MRPDLYHDDLTTDSHSSLKLLRESPAIYAAQRVYRTAPRPKPTRAMVVGQALHTLALEPDEFPNRFVRIAGRRKPSSDTREQLTPKEVLLLNAMGEAMLASPLWRNAMEAPGVIEEPIYWADPETEAPLKCRPDKRVGEDVIVDLKTITAIPRTGTERTLVRHVYDYGYHCQAAIYLEGLRHGKGVEGGRFCFVFVAKEPPHRVVPVELDDELLLLGHRQNQETLAELKRRRETNDWAEEAIDKVLTLSAERWMT